MHVWHSKQAFDEFPVKVMSSLSLSYFQYENVLKHIWSGKILEWILFSQIHRSKYQIGFNHLIIWWQISRNTSFFIQQIGALMEHFLEGIGTLTHTRRVTNTNLLFRVNLPKHRHRALPSRKFSMKAPAKCKTFVYVLTEICHQRKMFEPFVWCTIFQSEKHNIK